MHESCTHKTECEAHTKTAAVQRASHNGYATPPLFLLPFWPQSKHTGSGASQCKQTVPFVL